jgi:hypothetical protein
LTVPRVAFFTDGFHEVNGVARTSREFARNQDYPFFSVHTGPQTACWTEANLTTCELKPSWASRIPSVVSIGGGPKYIIRPGVDGYAATDMETCAQSVLALYHDPALRHQMSTNARDRALAFSWEAVFRDVYAKYEEAQSSGLLRNFNEDRSRPASLLEA